MPVALGEAGLVVVESPLTAALVGKVGHDEYSSGKKAGKGSVKHRAFVICVLPSVLRRTYQRGDVSGSHGYLLAGNRFCRGPS
jgi:hypothetical protein